MRKTMLVVIMFFIFFLASANKIQVNLGLIVNDSTKSFVSLDSLKVSHRWIDDENIGYGPILNFLIIAEKLKINSTIVFMVKTNSYVKFIPIDSLTYNTHFHLSDDNIEYLKQILSISANNNSAVFWKDSTEWKDLSFLFGQKIFHKWDVSTNSPYCVETVTYGKPMTNYTDIFFWIILIVLVFLLVWFGKIYIEKSKE